MKIKRNVNGQEMEFELTHAELYKAFYEQERECHKEDIQSVLEEKGLIVSDEQFDLIVSEYDDYLSELDGWRYAAEEAISTVMYS